MLSEVARISGDERRLIIWCYLSFSTNFGHLNRVGIVSLKNKLDKRINK